MNKTGMPLTCYIHVIDRELCNLLKADYEFNRTASDRLRLEFFNSYDDGARALLNEYPPFGSGHESIAIVGFGSLGESVVLRAASEWLFYKGRDGSRLSVAVVDAYATKKISVLSLRYPLLGSTCEFRAYDTDPADPGSAGADKPGHGVLYAWKMIAIRSPRPWL